MNEVKEKNTTYNSISADQVKKLMLLIQRRKEVLQSIKDLNEELIKLDQEIILAGLL